MKTIVSVVVIAAAFTAFALKAPGWAQAPRPSQHGSVTQQVGGTTIQLSTDVKINGQALADGTYSLWAEPQADKWTMIFNKAQPVFHTRYPADQDVLRVQATPRQGSHMETLAFYFPVVDGTHAELVFHWGTVVVPLSIDVP